MFTPSEQDMTKIFEEILGSTCICLNRVAHPKRFNRKLPAKDGLTDNYSIYFKRNDDQQNALAPNQIFKLRKILQPVPRES